MKHTEENEDQFNAGLTSKIKGHVAAGLIGARRSFRVVLTTLIVAALALCAFVAMGGNRTMTHDPYRIDAGPFRSWGARHDNDAILETRNYGIFGKSFNGGVDTLKHTRNGSYRVDADDKGYIYRPVGAVR